MGKSTLVNVLAGIHLPDTGKLTLNGHALVPAQLLDFNYGGKASCLPPPGNGTMERIAFTMRVKPGQEAEYRRRHRAVWPEMLKALKDARCSNYSSFMKGQDPFACMEVTDFERFKSHMAASPDAPRREAPMAGIMERGILPEAGFHEVLGEVFHLG